MALVLMTDQELRDIGIASQLDSSLCRESGVFNKKGWLFEYEDVSNDGLQFVRKYTNIDSSSEVYLVSNKTTSTIITGDSYSKYQFYKDE